LSTFAKICLDMRSEQVIQNYNVNYQSNNIHGRQIKDQDDYCQNQSIVPCHP